MIAGRIVDAENLVYAIVAGVEIIETNEASEESINGALAYILRACGYDEINSYAAAMVVGIKLHQHISDALWKTHSAVGRVKVIMDAVKLGMDTIDQGKIDENLRHKTAQVLEAAKRRNAG